MTTTPGSGAVGGAGQAGQAGRRRDLAAMVVPLARTLVAAEEPVLRAHQVSMWGYVVLTALAAQPVRTQAALAQSIGADKSRIIGVLDELQERGLIERQPDPADRRVHLLALTKAGHRLRESVRDAIQRQEEERVLAALSEADRAVFLRALRVLSELPPEDIQG
ncbi:MAG TPA: MarR family transcriptional regulator [Streptosporangiaceae bacterium]|jgi:DNA-binding MarR family transcriptional regulator|nr:MarR family transcriptional regulator [Streptosporangiaceae bacterium]